ncbi:Arsenite efflux pump ArsB, ACR3 family [Devosia lucknowensis]|uniref:Arsenite efflux pump ArsB, ACR3 family n=1 Tax=Devosia lucknowensis TaxID=1096929 RepID=A0A1Y6F0T2_9HYPH|nr:arsenic resistance protein [Devosia lucknowensis]SMQ68478.1 Arsenite efflux pump ArsB, ACR3 family [Devosia lucknowensis]
MNVRKTMEAHQVAIYFVAIFAAIASSVALPTAGLAVVIEPALALMLFATFLQVPLADLGRALLRVRFLTALLVANFVALPMFVLALVQFAPADPMVRLGVLMVLLTPCIDYVVTFSHVGRADARSLLASTPILLLLQMALLPVYLGLFVDDEASSLVRLEPFVHAFVWLIVVPLALAAAVQFVAARRSYVESTLTALDVLQVPATALVLFLVFASVVPQLGLAVDSALLVLPIYAAFAVGAPVIGWGIARTARLTAPEMRAVAFSAGTRNSLVVLPLAFAVPGAVPLLPAVIVAQTVVELVASLFYMRTMPVLGNAAAARN